MFKLCFVSIITSDVDFFFVKLNKILRHKNKQVISRICNSTLNSIPVKVTVLTTAKVNKLTFWVDGF